MTPETKKTVIEALGFMRDEKLRVARDYMHDLLPLERKYHQGRDLGGRLRRRNQIASDLLRIRCALRELAPRFALPRLDCE